MLLGARDSFRTGGISARDYIQDGLVAMWDGIENAGWGIHDPNATVWTPLVGGEPLTLTNRATWRSDEGCLAMLTAGSVPAAAYGARSDWAPMQFEVVAKWASGAMVLSFGSGSERMLIINGKQRCQGDSNVMHTAPYSLANINTYSVRSSSTAIGSARAVYQNLSGPLANAGGNTWGRAGVLSVGARHPGSESYRFYGRVYSIRFYNRDLTAAEMRHNHEADKARFKLTA